MKKKLLVILTLIMAVTLSMCLFTACDGDDSGEGQSSGGSTAQVVVTFAKESVDIKVGFKDRVDVTTDPANVLVRYTSSNESIATVTAGGVIRGISIGQATITAKAGAGTATLTVNITENVFNLSLDKETATIDVMNTPTVQLTASDDSETPLTYKWTSSNKSVATVDSTGLVTGISAGEATITITAGGKTKTCVVTVTAPEGYYGLTSGANKEVSNNAGKWYMYTELSSGSMSGYHSEGKVYLNVADATDVKKGYFLRYQPADLKEGSIYTLKATVTVDSACVLRVYGPKASDYTKGATNYVQCSEGDNVFELTLAVNTTTPQPLSFAICTAKASNSYKTGSYSMVISNVTITPVFEIQEGGKKIETKTASMSAGSVQLATNMTNFPAGSAVVWSSSDPTVATVDEATGLVTYVAEGNTTITATYETLTATCELTISSITVAFTQKSYTIKNTETVTVEATATPSGTVEYSSSDAETATVDPATGLVTPLKDGVVTITATCGFASDTCEIIIASNTVTFANKTASIDMDTAATAQLTATSDDGETVTYTSSDTTIATVDETGLVTALKIGEVTITATCGYASDTCVVTIIGSTVELDKKQVVINLADGATAQLSATTSGGKTVTYTSSDTTIATVNETTGLITALKAGYATITATCGFVTDTCKVAVVTNENKIATTQTTIGKGNAADINVESGAGIWYWNDSNGIATNYAIADGVLTVTADGTKAWNKDQTEAIQVQLRYMPEYLGTDVSASYMLVATIKNNATEVNTISGEDLTYTSNVNGHQSDVLISGSIGLDEETTVIINFTVKGGQSTAEFLNIKLLHMGVGDVTLSNMYVVKLS